MKLRMEEDYRSSEAADDYFLRHRKSAIRRFVTLREGRIVESLLRRGGLDPSRSRQDRSKRPLLLDSPCGTGRMTSYLRSRDIDAVDLDSSLQMIQRGSAAGLLPASRAVAGTLLALPFPDRTFQGAVCIRFMHHLNRPETRSLVLQELRRVTGGPAVISVWTGQSIQWTRRIIKQALGRRPSSRYKVALSTIREEAARADWRIVKVRYLFRFISETAYLLLI